MERLALCHDYQGKNCSSSEWYASYSSEMWITEIINLLVLLALWFIFFIPCQYIYFFSLEIMSLWKNMSTFLGKATSVAEDKTSYFLHFHNNTEKRSNSESSTLCQLTSLLKGLFLFKKKLSSKVTLTEALFPKILFFQKCWSAPSSL